LGIGRLQNLKKIGNKKVSYQLAAFQCIIINQETVTTHIEDIMQPRSQDVGTKQRRECSWPSFMD
jgi:hypothetical protein